MLAKDFRFAWATQDQKPIYTTSPFFKVWSTTHKATCAGHGQRAHVFNGSYFGDAPSGLYTDIECLGCGEHYRESK